LRPKTYARFQRRASAHQNRAVFEIPDFMERVLAQSAYSLRPSPADARP
jgi:hypothetical protein